MSLLSFNGSVANPAQNTVLFNSGIDVSPQANTITARFRGGADGSEPRIDFNNFGATGAVGTITFDTASDVFGIGNDINFGSTNNPTTEMRFITSNFTAPLHMTYSSNAGYRCATFNGNSTYIFGPSGATAGDSGATPILKVDGASGEGRVFDTVYNTAPTQSHASFSSSVDQAIGSTGASQVITYNTTDVATANITRGGTGQEGRITCAAAGVYKVLTRVQFTKSSSNASEAYVWFAIDGTNVANSSSSITLAGDSANALATVEVILTLTANQYIEVVMAGDSTDISAEHLASQASPYARPANPSIITTVVKLS